MPCYRTLAQALAVVTPAEVHRELVALVHHIPIQPLLQGGIICHRVVTFHHSAITISLAKRLDLGGHLSQALTGRGVDPKFQELMQA
jgi:hypothetical protein